MRPSARGFFQLAGTRNASRLRAELMTIEDVPRKQDGQTLLLYRGVETADDGPARVAELGDLVKGTENDLTLAFGGTEKRGERLAQGVWISQNG